MFYRYIPQLFCCCYFPLLDPWLKPWVELVQKMLQMIYQSTNICSTAWSQKASVVIWSSFLSELIGLCNSNRQPASFPRLSLAVPMLPRDMFHTQPPETLELTGLSVKKPGKWFFTNIFNVTVSFWWLLFLFRSGCCNPSMHTAQSGGIPWTVCQAVITKPAHSKTERKTFTTTGNL